MLVWASSWIWVKSRFFVARICACLLEIEVFSPEHTLKFVPRTNSLSNNELFKILSTLSMLKKVDISGGLICLKDA